METFNFPYHRVRNEYPASSAVVQLGRSWTFTSEPDAPDQRTFILSFPVMKYFVTGGNVDDTINPMINMHALDLFYQTHRQHAEFIYPHPVYGNLVVRFKDPLQIPEGIPGGDGAVEAFEVRLIEVPGL